MAAESLATQLGYAQLEQRKDRWVIDQQVEVREDWLPFHFAYADIFNGLIFKPIDLKWRRLTTVQDLFDLCFQFSLILWLSYNNQTEDPRGLALELFGIPRDFKTADLPLKYGHRCSDPLARVTTFRPLSPRLQYYTEDDCATLIDWYGFDQPDYWFERVIEGMKASPFMLAALGVNYARIPRPSAQFQGEGSLASFLRYALQRLNTPFPRFNLTGRTTILTPASYMAWEIEWQPWITAQFSRLVLCHKSMAHYMGAGFGSVNPYCRRSGDKEFDDMARKLLNLFTLTPPLPASLIVSRAVSARSFRTLALDIPHTEEGFMSVSLVGLVPSFFGSTTYMYLNLPAGIPILALLARLNHQQELLLPPGTRYILRRRWEEGSLVKYEGEVLL